MSEAIRSVAVVGGGIVALSATLALARALPGAQVTLIATPVAPGALADRLPVVQPDAIPMLDRLGIDAEALLARGVATPRLAQRFENWSRDRRAWHLADGGPGAAPGPGALHQRWLEAARAGEAAAFDTLFPGAVLAQAGRFAPALPPPLDAAEPALRLDAEAFAGVLSAGLARTRATVRRGPIARVERDAAGRIEAIALADGTRIAADLFVDATGPDALLGGDAPFEDWFEDWGAALPCDRLLLHRAAPVPTPLTDIYAATEIGWSARWPFPAGEWRAVAFAATTREDRARRTLASGRDTADLVTLRPGRRGAGWRGNVLALGEAAVQPGALGLAGLSLAWAQLILALDLLPGRTMPALLIAEYNRRAGLRADRVRDFLAAHHLAGKLRGTIPAGLAATLAQFERRGLLPHHEEETMSNDAWATVLIGQGLRPLRRDPQAMATDRQALATARAAIVAAVARVPA